MKSYQTKFKQSGKEMSKYSTNFSSRNSKKKLKPDNAVGMPGIHRFCDVGEKAYGSAMFLRWKLDDGSYTCVQLMA